MSKDLFDECVLCDLIVDRARFLTQQKIHKRVVYVNNHHCHAGNYVIHMQHIHLRDKVGGNCMNGIEWFLSMIS